MRRFFPENVTRWYVTGCILLLVKLACVVLGIYGMATSHSVGIGFAIWIVGKVSPTLICIFFLIDALQIKRAISTRIFWAALSVIVPLYTIWVVIIQLGR